MEDSDEKKAPNEDVGEEMKTDFVKRCDVAMTTILYLIDGSCAGSVFGMDNQSQVQSRMQGLFHTVSRATTDALLKKYQGTGIECV